MNNIFAKRGDENACLLKEPTPDCVPCGNVPPIPDSKKEKLIKQVRATKIMMGLCLAGIMVLCVAPLIVTGMLGSLLPVAGFNYGIEFYLIWMISTIVYTAKFMGNCSPLYFKVYYDYGVFWWIISIIGWVLHFVFLLVTFLFNLPLYSAPGFPATTPGFPHARVQTVKNLLWGDGTLLDPLDLTPVTTPYKTALGLTIFALIVQIAVQIIFVVLSLIITYLQNRTVKEVMKQFDCEKMGCKGQKYKSNYIMMKISQFKGAIIVKGGFWYWLFTIICLVYEILAIVACVAGTLMWWNRISSPRDVEFLAPAPVPVFLVMGGVLGSLFLRMYSDLSSWRKSHWGAVVIMILVFLVHIGGLIVYFSIQMPVAVGVCGYVFCSPAFDSIFFQGITANIPYGSVMGITWIFAGICFAQILAGVVLIVILIIRAVFVKGSAKKHDIEVKKK